MNLRYRAPTTDTRDTSLQGAADWPIEDYRKRMITSAQANENEMNNAVG